MRIIILLLTLVHQPLLAYNDKSHLLEQQMQPVVINPMSPSKVQRGRTYNHHPQARALAPKIKSYPFLDQLEFLIYPGRDFKLENPGKRLVRLETAVFGDKQSGSIPKRLSRLKDEITSWQIANMQTMEILSSDKKHEHAFLGGGDLVVGTRGKRIRHVPTKTHHSHSLAPTTYHPPPRKDYDYMNYRATTPLVQSMARKAIEVMFQ